MAVILGIISLVSLGAAVFIAFRNDGAASLRYGFVVALAVVYSATGLVLGITTVTKSDYYKLFPVLAILLNGAALGAVALILYMGAYS